MSAKTSNARRKTFLKALAETGNLTLAAERSKVSRSWVCLHRSADAGFDAACREAIAVARMILADDAAREPAKRRWHYHDGEELVVSGTRGVRTQIRRAKLKQWTARVEQRFLDALAASCNARAALAAVGMSKGSAYAHRKRFHAFARAWDEAVAIGIAQLDAALVEHADYVFDPDPGRAPPEVRLREMTVSDLLRIRGAYDRKRR